MTFLDDCPSGRSQLLTFPRRELLQKIASAALLFFVPRSQSAFEFPKKYPVPQFRIGDKILSLWLDDDEDIHPEFGEIMGVCWHPRNEQWEYIINWTAGDSAEWMYPCFDETLINRVRLRLCHD